jgi:hypothetical protein
VTGFGVRYATHLLLDGDVLAQSKLATGKQATGKTAAAGKKAAAGKLAARKLARSDERPRASQLR